jgi:hypothetical protein
MSAYLPNSYRVTLFDRFGAKVRTVSADSFLQAMAEGERRHGLAECHSFAISRVLYNSLTPQIENFDVRPLR